MTHATKTSPTMRTITRMLLASAALTAAAVTAGCAPGPTATTEASTAETKSSEVAATPVVTDAPAAATAETTSQAPVPGHGGFLLRQVEALDLRPEQQTAIAALRSDLDAKLAPTHAEAVKMKALLATSIDTGKVDEGAVEAERVVVDASLVSARNALLDAANTIHATLDADQRAELVANLRARRDGLRTQKEIAETGDASAEPPRHGLGRLATELGLTAEQQKSLHEGARTLFETAFPDHKARREAFEAEVKTAEEAFQSDTFDAHQYSFGKDAIEAVHSAAGGAVKLSGLAASVLTQSQRTALAEHLRANESDQ